MSQADDSVKSDKIKALTLAKECYAMKLELLTNATVINDPIRFVASYAITPTTEKAKFHERDTIDKEVVIAIMTFKDLKKILVTSNNQ